MSEILGMGANTYRLYESGEMPTVANGRLILSIREPEEFIRQLKAGQRVLTKTQYTKYLNHAEKCIIAKQLEQSQHGNMIVLRDDPPSEFNGYRRFSFSRTAQVITYLSLHVKNLTKTKLNKLLFYSDFLAYQQQGYSMTGLNYRAIPYGPVPSEYERLFLRLQEEEKLELEEMAIGEQAWEVYKPKGLFQAEDFSKKELITLERVVKCLGKKTRKELVELSHEEPAWKENQEGRKRISYQEYGFSVGAYLT
jgi:uncharacterized phage-associated protein